MEKIITKGVYEEWLSECNDKHIIEEDIRMFNKQIERIKELIDLANKELGK